MKTTLHKSENRGHANHGWLVANHSFSFANWHNPDKMGFGALRVLNDDTVAAGKGFGSHPHKNMEIVTLVQQGSLTHKDSLGNGSIMYPNDVQVMSAGTGVYHSEYNPDDKNELKLFQIWVLPDTTNVEPRYEQKTFAAEDRANKWQQIICPSGIQTESSGIFVYQQSWFYLVDLSTNNTIEYVIKKPNNGIFVFIIEGSAQIDNQILNPRDALEIVESDKIQIFGILDSRILVIEVPV